MHKNRLEANFNSIHFKSKKSEKAEEYTQTKPLTLLGHPSPHEIYPVGNIMQVPSYVHLENSQGRQTEPKDYSVGQSCNA